MALFGIIPARYASTRFPGKPLAPILGKPMIWHVMTRAARCAALDRVVLATDDARIFQAATDLGLEAVMTREDHASGTDRVCEAARHLGAGADDVIVNIQGDEPALNPAMLEELAAPFADPAVRTATLARRITAQEAASPDQVKVVVAKNGDALYFSRAPIPFDRDGGGGEDGIFLGHIGLYAFRFTALERFTALLPSPLEQREKLEQLRLLENSIPIRVAITEYRSHGVDRPEDIALIEAELKETEI